MINYDEKFIFVHIYKTGGGSIRSMLPISPKNMIQYKLNKSINKIRTRLKRPRRYLVGQLDEHAKAIDYKNFLHEDFNSFFSFAVVRHPYTWHMSLYSYARSRAYHPEHRILRDLSFSEYLDWRRSHQVNQYSFLYERDKCILNKIYKFEDLVCGRSQVFEDLGLVDTKLTAKKNSSPAHPDMTEKDKEKIYKLNAEDFIRLNYKR